MPNRPDHDVAGASCGTVFALWRADQSPSGSPLLEAIGGFGGGIVGSRWPDQLEPARWNHRQTAHSAATGGLLLALTENIEAAAEWCRRQALVLEAEAEEHALSPGEQLLHALAALVLRLLAGFFNGLAAGYLSHLVLDGCTPACIPLV